MPVPSASRQANCAATAWFQRPDHVSHVLALWPQLSSELERVHGSHGVALHAGWQTCADVPAPVSRMLSLYRQGPGFHGDLCCESDRLPLLSSSQSLVVAAFVLETVPAPERLLAECARVLRPEGVLLALTLNPWSFFRLQSGFPRRSVRTSAHWLRAVKGAGLTVQTQRSVGPCWPNTSVLGRVACLPALRLAHLLVAQRRDPAVTPVRRPSPALALAHGVNASG